MDHAAFRRLTAGAVLEDLDRDEAVELAVHWPAGDACRELGSDLRVTVADLSLAAIPRRPPASLYGDVVAAIRAADRTATPDATVAAAPEPRSRPGAFAPRIVRLHPFAAVATALAACLLVTTVTLGAYARGLGERLAAAESSATTSGREAAAQAAAVSLALDPRHASAQLHAEPLAPSAAATVLYRPGSADAYLVVADLPAAPAGRVYQLWVAAAGGAHPLATFTSDGSHPVVVPFGVDLAGRTAAMVTLEVPGGATGAPGPQVVFGELRPAS